MNDKAAHTPAYRIKSREAFVSHPRSLTRRGQLVEELAWLRSRNYCTRPVTLFQSGLREGGRGGGVLALCTHPPWGASC